MTGRVDQLLREWREKHRAGNVLGFCSWCGCCLDCKPEHRTGADGCERTRQWRR